MEERRLSAALAYKNDPGLQPPCGSPPPVITPRPINTNPKLSVGMKKFVNNGAVHCFCTTTPGKKSNPLSSPAAAIQGHATDAAVSTTKKRHTGPSAHSLPISIAITIKTGTSNTWLYGANIGITISVVAMVNATSQRNSADLTAARRSCQAT